jgi:hypothetical protein
MNLIESVLMNMRLLVEAAIGQPVEASGASTGRSASGWRFR